MHISGYYCEFDSGYYGDGGGFCGAMSDGQIAHLGAAACGPSYPLGTKFEIDGYGLVVCEDRGSGIGDNDIDVFVPFSSELESVPQGYENVTQVG
jgi:3D (Asp-Asp-Asp) domain-containing protein